MVPAMTDSLWSGRVSVEFGLLARNLPFAAPQLPEFRGRREGLVMAGCVSSSGRRVADIRPGPVGHGRQLSAAGSNSRHRPGADARDRHLPGMPPGRHRPRARGAVGAEQGCDAQSHGHHASSLARSRASYDAIFCAYISGVSACVQRSTSMTNCWQRPANWLARWIGRPS
jgi:hypothetical protein